MNFTRARLKQMAKNVIKHNYWQAVLIALLTSISLTALVNTDSNFDYLLPDSLTILLPLGGIVMILQILFFNVLAIACINTSIQLLYRKVPLSTIIDRLKQNYANTLIVQFIYQLVLVLWFLLFFFPGVYKYYQYRMIPYILAENPDITYQEARNMSKVLTQGEKWNIFVLDISFIGWYILSAFTFEIVNLLFVNPYTQFTKCALYEALKDAHPELNLQK